MTMVFAAGLFWALDAVGVGLEGLKWFAGFAGIGVGFGMQNIIPGRSSSRRCPLTAFATSSSIPTGLPRASIRACSVSASAATSPSGASRR